MRCSKCGSENPEGIKFCGQCANPLTLICPKCRFENPAGFKFCGQCTTRLSALEPGGSTTVSVAAGNGQRTSGERRHLTVLFCDLVGSTAMAAKMDPEEWRETVAGYHRAAADAIERFGGHVAKYLGDGVMAFFGYPEAHDNDAERAVRAGRAILDVIARLNEAGPLQLAVRIGIDSGRVVVGVGAGKEIDAFGNAANIAARAQAAAEPGTVVITGETHLLVEPFFVSENIGPKTLKGVASAVQLYQVRGVTDVRNRFEAVIRSGLTPLVGREEELRFLIRHWDEARSTAGRVVTLSGEPGIGKSRLVHALRDEVGRSGGATIEYRCSPFYQQTAWYPIVDHLQRLLQLQQEDNGRSKLDKLRQRLSRYNFPKGDTLSLVAALLSLPEPGNSTLADLSPQKRKEKTAEALIAWLLEEAERAPILAIWGDLHWADPSTLELIGMLLDQVPTSRLLMVMTGRPEFSPPWGVRSYVASLTVGRLPSTQALEMIASVARGKRLPKEITHQILSKTDGVPLFVEELTKTILESGLMREVGGSFELSGPLPPLAIPVTLQDSLMARLDRLSTAREVAQVGAVLGREFSYDLLRAVVATSEELQSALETLVHAEILHQRGFPPRRYIFKHALIQDSAYQSLLNSTRQQQHARVARILKDRFGDVADTQPELIAHHLTAAHLFEEAIPYWRRADEQAAARSGIAEAISHIDRGLQLLSNLPMSIERAKLELDLNLLLGPVLIASKGWSAPATEAVYQRAMDLSRQIGGTHHHFQVLWNVHRVCGTPRPQRNAEAWYADALAGT